MYIFVLKYTDILRFSEAVNTRSHLSSAKLRLIMHTCGTMQRTNVRRHISAACSEEPFQITPKCHCPPDIQISLGHMLLNLLLSHIDLSQSQRLYRALRRVFAEAGVLRELGDMCFSYCARHHQEVKDSENINQKKLDLPAVWNSLLAPNLQHQKYSASLKSRSEVQP